MKLRIVLFTLLAFVFTYASSQNILQIKNLKTGKITKIRNNNKITLLSSVDNLFVTGKIKQIKEKSIVLYFPDDEDLLREYDITVIQQIKKRTVINKVIRITGMALMPVGGFIFMTGVFLGVNGGGSLWGYWLAGGGAIFALGYVTNTFVKPKTFDMNKDYQLEVVKQ